MPKQNPAYHGHDHRPAGWTDAGDPGGADPFNWLIPLPTTVTDPLAQFKPQTQWLQGVDTITGAGGGFAGSASVTWTGGSASGVYSDLLDLSPASGTRPTPRVNGWYEAALSVKFAEGEAFPFTGIAPGDEIECILGCTVLSGGYNPDLRGAAIVGHNTPVMHVSLPTIHLTTSDYFEITVDCSMASAGTVTYTADLLVSLMLPGDP